MDKKDIFRSIVDRSVVEIVIPSSVTSIGNLAFAYCTSLTSVTIPSSVTSIVDGAFYECSSLTNATIPSSVTSIGASTFNGTGLINITIPSSVTSIGTNAFYSCSKLQSVRFEQPDGIEIAIGVNIFYSSKTAQEITVYTDNTSIYTTLSSTTYSNITLTILHLDGSTWG